MEGGVPEWSIGSPSSKGPSMLGLFGGVTSPIFTNDFRLCPADARENTHLLPGVTLEDGQTFYLRSLVLLFHIEK